MKPTKAAYKQLRRQLRDLGIENAIEMAGTSEGNPCFFLRNGANTEVFCGVDTDNPDSEWVVANLKIRFAN